MANTIKIKTGTSAPASSNLTVGELGYDTDNKVLYIGNGATPDAIGGGSIYLNTYLSAALGEWGLTVTAEKLNFTSDVTSNIQAQLNSKLSSTSPVSIADGGTGATTAADARANLELGDFALKNAPLNIPDGGTGAATAEGALSNLGAAAASHEHQAGNITSGTLPLERGGTSATTAEGALIALGGISITKVWETSTPNANYVSGTINMNLSGYDLALVMFYGFPDQHHIVSTFVTIGGGMGCVYFDTTQMGGGTNASRRFVVNSTNIVFERMWNSQSESSTGGALIPFRVCGIKGIQTI